jgi:hypothetical protein
MGIIGIYSSVIILRRYAFDFPRILNGLIPLSISKIIKPYSPRLKALSITYQGPPIDRAIMTFSFDDFGGQVLWRAAERVG